MEAGLMKKAYCQWELDCLINIWFYPYHFVRDILSNTILSQNRIIDDEESGT